MAGRKRFIAGAVCPVCGVEDRIYVLQGEGSPIRGCSKCDFREELADVARPPAPQPVWQPVKLVGPGDE